MTTFLVRPARLADIPALDRLARRVEREFHVALRPSEPAEIGSNSGLAWVVETGRGEIVGSCGIWETDGGVWALHSLFLMPNWRGFGLGRNLVEEALRAAALEGALAVECTVVPELAEAENLLLRLGFTSVEKDSGKSRCFRKEFGKAS